MKREFKDNKVSRNSKDLTEKEYSIQVFLFDKEFELIALKVTTDSDSFLRVNESEFVFNC